MLTIEKLIRTIADQAKAKYQLKRIEIKKEWENKGYEVYFAHELTQCSLKRRYETIFPELKENISFKPRVMIGEMVESAVKSYLKLEGSDNYKVLEGKKKYAIFGGIDMYNPKSNAVFDIKYTTAEPVKRDHHELRVKLYNWLLDTDKGALIYISPRGFKQYLIREALTDKEVLELIEKPIAPRYSGWECKYCMYSDICSFATISKEERM